MDFLFSNTLINWFSKHQRDLPWRKTNDPYSIWLSEVILQQTRVNQGLPYFQKFITTYPTVHDLARASEDEVLKMWQGLGYYSRGRRLLATAKAISEMHEFPKKYESLIELNGIGDYTASAISSFSNNEYRAVLDGNVFRVLSRYFGLAEPINSTSGKKKFQELALSMLPRKNTSTYNQAIMEFGALQCIPKNPDCSICPLQDSCYALSQKKINTLPVKNRKKAPTALFLYFAVININDHLLLRKRPKHGIWARLFEFPNLEFEVEMPEIDILENLKAHFNIESPVLRVSHEYHHALTHRKIKAKFFEFKANQGFKIPEHCTLVSQDEIHTYAVPRLLEKYLNEKKYN